MLQSSKAFKQFLSLDIKFIQYIQSSTAPTGLDQWTKKINYRLFNKEKYCCEFDWLYLNYYKQGYTYKKCKSFTLKLPRAMHIIENIEIFR